MSILKESNFSPEIYAELLIGYLPKVIKNKEEYNRAENILKSLISKNRTPEEEYLAELLQLLLSDYDRNQLAKTAQILSTRNVVRQARQNLEKLSFLKILRSSPKPDDMQIDKP